MFVVEQEQKPSYSVSLDDSICIKDMRWAKKDAKSYVILSSHGKLYHGSGQGPITCVTEGVDSGMVFFYPNCCSCTPHRNCIIVKLVCFP